MKHNRQEKLKDRLALGWSICFHGVLLLGAYYSRFRNMPTLQSAEGYRITLHKQFMQVEKISKTAPQASPTIIQPEKQQSIQPSREGKVKMSSSSKKEQNDEQLSAKHQVEETNSTTTEQEAAKPTIDQRSLYTPNRNKQTGALLELVGWIWDTVPEPQDNTDETGKLVCEIKIDDSGEVIAVKTLEKTVSPLVEQIYKEALTKLTFSKTSQLTAYAPISTGKVTFIIQSK